MLTFFNWPIEQLPGLKSEEQKLLRAYGIYTTQDLLKQTVTLQQKENLANSLKIPLRYLHKWVAMADLAQIPSVGCRYCGLLLHCGIISLSQLAVTSLPKLQRQIQKIYVVTQQKKEDRPSLGMIQNWLKEARSLQHSQKFN